MDGERRRVVLPTEEGTGMGIVRARKRFRRIVPGTVCAATEEERRFLTAIIASSRAARSATPFQTPSVP